MRKFKCPPPGFSSPLGVVVIFVGPCTVSSNPPTLGMSAFNPWFLGLGFSQDDMIIIGSDVSHISKVKQRLFGEFEMKDLGLLRYFLGIEVCFFS